MEKINSQMLELIGHPAFCVDNGIITQVNTAAKQRMVEPGAEVITLISSGKEAYADFQEGCLYVTLEVCGSCWGASVTVMGGVHLFLLDQDNCPAALQALSLTALHLRKPLSEIMSAANMLTDADENCSGIRHGTYKLLRMIHNMEDASRYMNGNVPMLQHDMGKVIGDVIEKVTVLAQAAQITLHYKPLTATVISIAEPERLERAVYNLLSNALQTTPKGGCIHVSLTHKRNMLYFTVQDGGTGIPEQLRSTIFTSFMREPALHDGHFGLGLGMAVVRAAAACHDGAVLVEFPENQGARVTMTIPIRQKTENTVRTPTIMIDRFGGFDQALIELSDALPLSVFENLS